MKTVLIVDDDPLVLESTRTYLETREYNTVCANNGLDAQERIKDRHIDIALVDIFMPEQGGLEFILTQKNTFPIIAMSGIRSADFDTLDFAQSIGAVGCLSKPFAPEKLIEVIENS